MNLEDILLRDTRANQPLASAVVEGSLYYVTDEAVTEQSRASVWVTYSDASTIANDSVTYAKIQNVSVTDRLLGRDTAAAGNIEEIPVSSGLEFTNGPGLKVSNAVRTRQIGITIDGAGAVITTGIKGFKSFPVAGTITGVRMLADQSGSAVVDIWKDTYANYPPTVADTITAAAKPTITTAIKSEDTTLTGWNVTVNAGDVFGFNVDSAATITRLTLELTILVS